MINIVTIKVCYKYRNGFCFFESETFYVVVLLFWAKRSERLKTQNLIKIYYNQVQFLFDGS